MRCCLKMAGPESQSSDKIAATEGLNRFDRFLLNLLTLVKE